MGIVYDGRRKQGEGGDAEIARHEDFVARVLRQCAPEVEKALRGLDSETAERVLSDVLAVLLRMRAEGETLAWNRWLVLAVRAASRHTRAATRERFVRQLALGVEEWVAEHGEALAIWQVRGVRGPCRKELEAWVRGGARARRVCLRSLAARLAIGEASQAGGNLRSGARTR